MRNTFWTVPFVCILLVACNKGEENRSHASYAESTSVSDSVSSTAGAQGSGLRKELDSVAASCSSLSPEEFTRLCENFAVSAHRFFAVGKMEMYNAFAPANIDPYANAGELKAVSDSMIARIAKDLNSFFAMSSSPCFTVQYEVKDVRYYVNREVAEVVAPELSVKEREVALQNFIAFGRFTAWAPSIMPKVAPVWKHRFNKRGGQVNVLLGGFEVAVPINTAKSLDIVKNKGIVDCTFRLTSVATTHRLFSSEIQPAYFKDLLLKDRRVMGTYTTDLSFPVWELMSARWIVDNDTLWWHGEGRHEWKYGSIDAEEFEKAFKGNDGGVYGFCYH